MDDRKIEYYKLLMEAWKQTVNVQMHFNDLELRIRNYALTLLGVLLGATGVAVKNDVTVQILDVRYSPMTWLVWIGVISWTAFYFMDRWWYHQFLRAAGIEAAKMEQGMKHFIPSPGLSTAISRASPAQIDLRIFGVSIKAEIRSNRKIDIFYSSIGLPLAVVALFSTDARGAITLLGLSFILPIVFASIFFSRVRSGIAALLWKGPRKRWFIRALPLLLVAAIALILHSWASSNSNHRHQKHPTVHTRNSATPTHIPSR